MGGGDLKARTKAYGLQVIALVEELPRRRTADVLGTQLLRCATSVGANYRAARRAKSSADFIAKMKIVEEEADESLFWLEMLGESSIVPQERLTHIMAEGNALVAITVAAIKTARSHNP